MGALPPVRDDASVRTRLGANALDSTPNGGDVPKLPLTALGWMVALRLNLTLAAGGRRARQRALNRDVQ
jgi:hypothetical protein